MLRPTVANWPRLAEARGSLRHACTRVVWSHYVKSWWYLEAVVPAGAPQLAAVFDIHLPSCFRRPHVSKAVGRQGLQHDADGESVCRWLGQGVGDQVPRRHQDHALMHALLPALEATRSSRTLVEERHAIQHPSSKGWYYTPIEPLSGPFSVPKGSRKGFDLT